MSRFYRQVEKSLILLGGLFATSLLGGVHPLSGQELILKRTLPGGEAFSCPPHDQPPVPGEEERTEAGRLGSNANQALILGDLERARDLLARATELDPTSSELAYRYARVLEDLGERSQALDVFCRVLLLGTGADEIRDVPARVEAIQEWETAQVPEEALDLFQAGLTEADQNRFEDALRSFGMAWQAAPDWADPVFNRGIIQARLGRADAAAADLQRYLTLRPEAEDALSVSQVVGQLGSLADLPRPSAAFSLGLLFPGAGQFYSGRAWGGLSVLAMTAGAAAAGFLIEEVTVMCVGTVPSGGECPPDRIIGEDTDTPYLVHGLVAAGTVAFLGAVESFFRARGQRGREIGALVAMEFGETRIAMPSLSAAGPRLHVNLVQVTF